MPDVKNILQPRLPDLPKELEEFTVTKIELNDWLDLINSFVSEKNLKDIQKLRIENSKLVGTKIRELNLDKCEISNAHFERVDATAFHTYRASFNKVLFSDTRATGADFAEGYFEDCKFKNVKLDEASFRMAHMKRVHFENCVLNKADFYQAKLTHVTFSGCELEQTNFDKAACQAVDFRGENLSLVQGILGLKGARLSQEQLIQIAPLLAAELGFVLTD